MFALGQRLGIKMERKGKSEEEEEAEESRGIASL